MPLITVKASNNPSANHNEILKTLSKKLSTLTRKPESYVMTILETNVPMTFAGTSDPCAFVEVKSIGSLFPQEMSSAFCEILEESLQIPSNRIYISFSDIPPSDWGFNGRTFG